LQSLSTPLFREEKLLRADAEGHPIFEKTIEGYKTVYCATWQAREASPAHHGEYDNSWNVSPEMGSPSKNERGPANAAGPFTRISRAPKG
jgi:hypothetical protein